MTPPARSRPFAAWTRNLLRKPANPPANPPAAVQPAAQRRYYGPWRSVVLVDAENPHRVVGACDFFDQAAGVAYAELIATHAPHLGLNSYTVTWSPEAPDTDGWWIDSAEQVVTGVLTAPELWINFPPPAHPHRPTAPTNHPGSEHP